MFGPFGAGEAALCVAANVCERFCHETPVLVVRPRPDRRRLDPGSRSPNAEDGAGSRHPVVRCQPGVAGLFRPRRQGQLDGPRRRRAAAPSPPPSSTTRPRSNSCRCPPRIASRRCSPARSTCCRATRHGRCRATPRWALNFTGVTYYDGQGFLVTQVAQGEFRAGAQQRLDLRADRHHHRAEPRRLSSRATT